MKDTIIIQNIQDYKFYILLYMDYKDKDKDKYIKYKTKYLELRNMDVNNQIGGGNLIIHISGSQGAGKTTLGNKIKEKYDDMIYLKDLDDLYDEFINQKKIKDYQEFINNFIKENSNKPLILTGLSAERCKGEMDDDDDTFFEINTDYKYLIKIDENDILKQRFFRQVSKLNDRKEMFFEAWLKNNDDIQKKLFRYVDLLKWKTNNIACNTIHKKHNYKIMDKNDIYHTVCNLIDELIT
jgi:adenylate kinase family enzyme